MQHVSLYRKYRSQTFGDLVGQSHVVRALQNALKTGRISHAYLFTGPRGTGKTSSARLLAKALCCEKGPSPEPCNECSVCVGITDGSCMDVQEFDAASESGVDEVRETIVQVASYVPTQARFKVFIIDEVHDLSPKAFDALLKTIEEPPAHLIFVLATTEYHKVPPTIRSRCQKFEFHRGSVQDLAGRLQFVAEAENIAIDKAAINAIARMADGGYRDALNLLEQVSLTSEGPISMEHVYDQLGLLSDEAIDGLLFAMRRGDVAKIVTQISEFVRQGRDPRGIVESALYRLSELTRASLELSDSGDVTRDAALFEASGNLGHDGILKLRSALSTAHLAIRDVSLPKIWLESELIRIAQALNEAPVERPQPTQRAVVSSPSAAPKQPSAGAAEPAAPPRSPAPEPEREEPQPTARTNGTASDSAASPKVEPPAPAPETSTPPVVEPTDDPLLEEARQAWASTIADLQREAPSAAITVRLIVSKVVSFDGKRLTIGLGRNMDKEWFHEQQTGAKRQRFLMEFLSRHGGGGWTLEFTVNARVTKPAESDAVEMPAEGQKLVEIAKEVFPGG